MTVIAFGSAKASPGVTTAVLALAAVWPAERELLLVEADPDGGDLAARNGLRLEPSLSTLAAVGRHTLVAGEVANHVQHLPGRLPAVIAPADPQHATRALQMVGARLAEVLGDGDVLIDVGRIRPGTLAQSLVDAADRVMLVARPTLDELQHVGPCMRTLAERGREPSLLLIGERPDPPEEVAGALSVTVAGSLPHDPDAAEALNGWRGGPSRLRRSRLLRSARDLAEQICAMPESKVDSDRLGTRDPSSDGMPLAAEVAP